MAIVETAAAALAIAALAAHLIRQLWILLRDRGGRESITLTSALRVAVILLLALHLVLLSIRRGFPAITEDYETLVLFALLLLIAVQIVPRIRGSHAPALLSDFLSLTLLLISSSPLVPYTIVPPVPALRSNWLAFHIILSFLGEAFFTVAFVSSILFLLGRDPSRKALYDRVTYVSIAFGYVAFTLGALLFGAIWAYQAWGRYWGWDPKEVWSLVTWLVYSLYLHLRFVRGASPRLGAITSVVGYLATLFTLFGVNLLYDSLHAY
ncbi:MAG: cytochrome c biogenesis protein [Alkalispirochaetaceae bacterium]